MVCSGTVSIISIGKFSLQSCLTPPLNMNNTTMADHSEHGPSTVASAIHSSWRFEMPPDKIEE